MRRLLRLTSSLLAFSLAIGGCSGGGGGTGSAPARTLSSVTPHLTRTLTPALARERLGAPDVETGSGLIIYQYRLEGGDTLSLGFPGYAPITYAHLLRADGTRLDLPLR